LSLKIFDTFQNKIVRFKPGDKNRVKIYICGPTVYGPSHLGHGRVGIFYDTLRRYLEYKGYGVEMVQNITDVGHLTDDGDTGEDKIEQKAKAEEKSPQEIANYYTKRHFNDMDKLNILRPTYAPKASEYIPKMIEFVEKLIDKDYAYESGGNVYFAIDKFSNYGQLSGKDLQEMMKSVRVEKDKNKKNSLDFALWLRAEPEHLQKWDSPWSKGYPGWHLECSVMNLELLGETIDIHGGAIELAFPHHENEIAQSEALTDKKFVRYWIHIGMVQVDGVKMGKSKNNFITLRELLKNYSSDQIRIALLMTHYRRPFDHTKQRLDEAQKILNKLIDAKDSLLDKEGLGLRKQFEEIMDSNLNTPKLFTFLVNNLESLDKKLFNDIKIILGLKLDKPVIPEKINKMAEERKKLRDQNKYVAADQIRRKIKKKGYQIRDIDDNNYKLLKK